MIKVLKTIVCLLIISSWNLSFSQVSGDSIAKNQPKNKHFFEVYAYLISQDALHTNKISVANSLNIIGDFVILGDGIMGLDGKGCFSILKCFQHSLVNKKSNDDIHVGV